MKTFQLITCFTNIVLGALLQRRQTTLDACDPRDECVQNIGLPESYYHRTFTDCAAYLETTSTAEGVTSHTTTSAPYGWYTTTTTIGWYVKHCLKFLSIEAFCLNISSVLLSSRPNAFLTMPVFATILQDSMQVHALVSVFVLTRLWRLLWSVAVISSKAILISLYPFPQGYSLFPLRHNHKELLITFLV
jgi:hypothetical protein